MLATGVIVLLAAFGCSTEGATELFKGPAAHDETEGFVETCADPPLHIAVMRNLTDMVKDLILNGEDMYEENCEGLNVMEVALKLDNEYLIKVLVDLKFDFRSRNRFGDSVLHTAVFFGRTKTLKWFIEKNLTVELDVVNYKNETPLFLSVFHKNTEAFDFLVKNGANVNLRLPGGNTYIHQATKISNARVLIFFAAFNVSIDAVNDDDQTAVDVATKMDKPAMINVILSQGADFRRKNIKGETYIHNAMKNEAINALRTLLRHHELLDEENIKGETPLSLAVEMNRTDLVNFLVDSGANFRKVLTNGKYYVHIAAQSNNNDALRVLLERGIPPDVKDSDGFTALYYAVISDNLQALGDLKKFGAELSICFPNQKPTDLNFLQKAAVFGTVEPIKWSVGTPLKSDRWIKHWYAFNYLQKAAALGNIKTIKRLVAEGLSVNATCGNEDKPPTALHVAVFAGKYESVLALLDLGVCVNCQTVYGNNVGYYLSACGIAKTEEFKDIYELFKSRRAC